MKNTRRAFAAFGIAFVLLVSLGDDFATCTGADPCHACKNCKYCHHCAKEGGTCGVCKK